MVWAWFKRRLGVAWTRYGQRGRAMQGVLRPLGELSGATCTPHTRNSLRERTTPGIVAQLSGGQKSNPIPYLVVALQELLTHKLGLLGVAVHKGRVGRASPVKQAVHLLGRQFGFMRYRGS